MGSRGWEQIERAGRCSRRACRLTMISGRSRAARASPWSRSFKRAAADHKCTRHRLCRRSRRPRAAAKPTRRAPPPLVRWERRPRRPERASCHPSVTLLEAPLPMTPLARPKMPRLGQVLRPFATKLALNLAWRARTAPAAKPTVKQHSTINLVCPRPRFGGSGATGRP